MLHIFYNTASGSHEAKQKAEALAHCFPTQAVSYVNVRELEDKQAYIDRLCAEDALVIAGGDGTLNRFINAIEDKDYPFPIYCHSDGSGNDFFKDVADRAENGLVQINDYIKNLPVVTVNGRDYKFLNGVGYGIDGYCCEEGERQMQRKAGKPINYTAIAIRGLLFSYKPRNATVVVDGVEHRYQRVWLAPTMNGRYYGGGMMVAPGQDRCNEQGTLSLVVMYGTGKLKTLMVFPSIFQGKHVEHTEMVDVLTGHQITVRFDRPTALQIDGETISGVTEYTAKSRIPATV